MFNKIKTKALFGLYKHHCKAGVRYFNKIDMAYDSDKNEYLMNRAYEHWTKGYNILMKLAII